MAMCTKFVCLNPFYKVIAQNLQKFKTYSLFVEHSISTLAIFYNLNNHVQAIATE